MSLKSLEQVFIKIGEECDTVFEEKGNSEKTERIDKYTEFIDEKEGWLETERKRDIQTVRKLVRREYSM